MFSSIANCDKLRTIEKDEEVTAEFPFCLLLLPLRVDINKYKGD